MYLGSWHVPFTKDERAVVLSEDVLKRVQKFREGMRYIGIDVLISDIEIAKRKGLLPKEPTKDEPSLRER